VHGGVHASMREEGGRACEAKRSRAWRAGQLDTHPCKPWWFPHIACTPHTLQCMQHPRRRSPSVLALDPASLAAQARPDLLRLVGAPPSWLGLGCCCFCCCCCALIVATPPAPFSPLLVSLASEAKHTLDTGSAGAAGGAGGGGGAAESFIAAATGRPPDAADAAAPAPLARRWPLRVTASAAAAASAAAITLSGCDASSTYAAADLKTMESSAFFQVQGRQIPRLASTNLYHCLGWQTREEIQVTSVGCSDRGTSSTGAGSGVGKGEVVLFACRVNCVDVVGEDVVRVCDVDLRLLLATCCTFPPNRHSRCGPARLRKWRTSITDLPPFNHSCFIASAVR